MKAKKIAVASAAAILAAATATASSAVAALPASARPHTGRAQLMLWEVNSDGPAFKAQLTGAAGDYGRAVTIDRDGKVDSDNPTELKLKLAHGSFRLSIAPIEKAFAKALRHWSPNPATCSGGIIVTAPGPVIAHSGTGAYRSITGSFSLTDNSSEVLPRSNCHDTGGARPLSELIVVDGTGAISY